MAFDKSKVYTAVNADELAIGSVCIFSDTYGDLQDSVRTNISGLQLISIKDKFSMHRFVDRTNVSWHFAYLISEPRKHNYHCYDSIDEAFAEIRKHGGWIKHNETGESFYVTVKMRCVLRIYGKTINCVDLLNDYVFADDGTPCGKIK